MRFEEDIAMKTRKDSQASARAAAEAKNSKDATRESGQRPKDKKHREPKVDYSGRVGIFEFGLTGSGS